MTRVIDCSIPDATAELLCAGGKIGRIRIRSQKQRTDYRSQHIASVTVIDEDAYRSGGKAAAGAIIGGVLTGGIGLLAGAAIGGRRRKTATYLIHFTDGNYLAFEETAKSATKALDRLIVDGKISDKLDGFQEKDIIPSSPPKTVQNRNFVDTFLVALGGIAIIVAIITIFS